MELVKLRDCSGVFVAERRVRASKEGNAEALHGAVVLAIEAQDVVFRSERAQFFVGSSPKARQGAPLHSVKL